MPALWERVKNKYPYAHVRRWYNEQLVNQQMRTKHEPHAFAHFRFTHPNQLHQADLVMLPTDKGHPYVLNVIDGYTRYLASQPIKHKTGETIRSALEVIYKQGPLSFPEYFQTDEGTEFHNEVVTTWLIENGTMPVFSLAGDKRKQGLIERVNRTIEGPIFRRQQVLENQTGRVNKTWVEELQAFVDTYNHSTHRAIGCSPAEAMSTGKVTEQAHEAVDDDADIIPNGRAVRTVIADKVRWSDVRWGDDVVYVVQSAKAHADEPRMYTLCDERGQLLERRFYRQELQPLPIEVHDVGPNLVPEPKQRAPRAPRVPHPQKERARPTRKPRADVYEYY